MKNYAFATLLVLVAGAIGPLASPSWAQTSDKLEVTEIRYQVVPGGQIAYVELADALGYMAPLTVKRLGSVAGGPADIQANATNQTEMASSFNGSVVNAVAAGAPIKAVVGYHGTDGDEYFGAWTLTGSPVHTARDLIGKKVGINTLGAAENAYIDEYLTRGGLSPEERKKVTLVPLPQDNIEQSLRLKQIDVGILNSSSQVQAKQRGGIELLFSDFQLFGKFTSASIVMNTNFIRKNPNTTRYFVGALAKAIVWSQTHPSSEVIEVYTKYLTAHGRALEVPTLKYWHTQAVANKGGVISDNEFSHWVTWLEGNGQIKAGKVKVSDLYTNEFNPYAKPTN